MSNLAEFSRSERRLRSRPVRPLPRGPRVRRRRDPRAFRAMDSLRKRPLLPVVRQPCTPADLPGSPAMDIRKSSVPRASRGCVRQLGHRRPTSTRSAVSRPAIPDGAGNAWPDAGATGRAARRASSAGRSPRSAANALEALGRLRRAYSGSIGYEDDHVQNAEERDWLREAAESRRFFDGFLRHRQARTAGAADRSRGVRAVPAEDLRPGQALLIEGTDMLVPMLDTIIDEAAQAGTREVVMGMAHRGRLNVLAHILGKPYAAILEEFQAPRTRRTALPSPAARRRATAATSSTIWARGAPTKRTARGRCRSRSPRTQATWSL